MLCKSFGKSNIHFWKLKWSTLSVIKVKILYQGVHHFAKIWALAPWLKSVGFICEQWSTREVLRSRQDCIIIKIARIHAIKEKLCLRISTKFSCAIHRSKTFHPAFGDTKECHTCSHAYNVLKVQPWPSLRFLPAFAHMAQALFWSSNFPTKCQIFLCCKGGDSSLSRIWGRFLTIVSSDEKLDEFATII